MKNHLYTANFDPDRPPTREVLDEVEAATYLNVSERKLRYLRQQNQIPFALIGKQIRYVRSELLVWLKVGGNKQEGTQ